MISKKGIVAAAALMMVVSVTTVCCQQKPSAPAVRQRPAAAVPAAAAPKVDEPSFDQQRLTALFGSQAQPVYGKRDPTTGQVSLETAAATPARMAPASRLTPPSSASYSEEEEDEEIDRKDSRVPETNEINPFELLPPQFHDLLNIPIHDYGNGTTYNPYDKYNKAAAPPQKSKYPLVSTGYANTKYQGSPPGSSTAKPSAGRQQPSDYDYDSDDYAPIKPFRRPPTKPKTNPTTTTRTTTTTTQEQQRYSRPTTAPPQRFRPSAEESPPAREQESFAVYRPKPSVQQSDAIRNPRPPTYEDESTSTLFREQTATYRPENRPDYKPDIRPKPKPEKRPTTTTTTDRPSFYDDEEDETFEEQITDDWPRPPEQPAGPSRPSRPSYEPERPDKDTKHQQKRPNYSVVAESQEPVFTAPSHQHRPDEQIAEIKVTPKPFYAADDNQNFGLVHPQLKAQQQHAGHVDDVPDIIYDYEDERSKGEGVLFMFDDPNSPSGPVAPVTQRPVVASPYPTVASREPRPQPAAFNPAFRPSAPVRQSSDSTFLPPPQGLLPSWNSPQTKPQLIDAPRPPFRFPTEQQPSKKENQPPNILPLFRPNTNPTDEFQFIKHPQQIEFQRQQQQQPAGPQFNHQQRPADSPQRQRLPATGISPLPSALQSPFSSISQAVANFFGRRSGSSGSQRSGNLNPSEKMDRSGIVDPTEMETNLDMAESSSGSFVLFSRPDQPLVPSPIAVDRSGLSLQHPQPPTGPAPGATPAAAHQQVVGIKVSPDAAGSKPPAFYVYTSRELEQGKPPYLVVGPVLSGPPNVAGAQLVHTAPAQPIGVSSSPESQRRNDFPVDGPSHPSANANSIPFPSAAAHQDEIPAARQPATEVRKPFFPISSSAGSSNNKDRLPTGLSPPRRPPPPNRRPPPGFLFPENPQETESAVQPQGISPVSQGIPPPRVPLNPQKDVASPYSNPTLLHSRPSAEVFHHQVTDHGLPVQSSVGVASVLNVPLYGEEANTPRPPPPKRKTTKSPYRTTTPIYMEAFNNPQQPVTYSTIQQEDGKQIAVVHPAYIVTYKPQPPELIDLDAPFIPSVESASKEGEMSSIPFEKWHAMPQEIERKGEEAAIAHHEINAPITSDKFEYQGGFLPLIPQHK